MSYFEYDRVVLPHNTNWLSVADIPWVLAWARMPYSSRIFRENEFEKLRKSYHDKIEQAFIDGDFEGTSLDAESKEPVFEQMLDSIKLVDDWRGYFSRHDIEVSIAEPSSSSGRYILGDASNKIAQATGEQKRAIQDWLDKAMLDGSLPVYPLGSELRYYPKRADNALPEEAYWDDLNTLLETSARDVVWRFLAPIKSSVNSTHTPTNKVPFSSPPLRQDDWFILIEEMMYKYENENGVFLNFSQVWSNLWDKPPESYSISTGVDFAGEDALIMGGDTLSKSACKKRFQRWNC